MTGRRGLVRGVFQRGPVYYFVRRIPNDLRQIIIGRTLRLSVQATSVTITFRERTNDVRLTLATRTKQEAQRIGSKLWDDVDDFFCRLRSGIVVELTHRQIMGVAGIFYAAWSRDPDYTPPAHYVPPLDGLLPHGAIADFQAESRRLLVIRDFLQELYAAEGEAIQRSLFDEISVALLGELGIWQITELCKKRLIVELANVLPMALQTRARFASGDYRPDEFALRFPGWEPPEAAQGPIRPIPIKGAVSLEGLVESWWSEAQLAGKVSTTYRTYLACFVRLKEFVGHDDPRRITHEDIQKYKAHRLSTPMGKHQLKMLAPQSFKTVDLGPLKTIFKWGVEQRLLTFNPANDVSLRLSRKTKLREKTFTDEEVRRLLSASLELAKRPKLQANNLLRRWVPWLCAYTGARIGEIVQLRKQDIKKGSDGVWTFTLSPEAFTIKTKEVRVVPIHAHLIEMGFLDFAKSVKSDYLFLKLKREDEAFRTVWNTRKTLVQRFARKYIPDPNVAPNHGWRHTFKSIGFEAGIQEKVLDAICGHAPSTVGRSYGSVSLKTKVDAISAFPRYIVEEGSTNAA